jgi:uncharacterized membrane protein
LTSVIFMTAPFLTTVPAGNLGDALDAISDDAYHHCNRPALSREAQEAMQLLLLGESTQGFRYLLGILERAGHPYQHLSAREPLHQPPAPFDVVLISDYRSANIAPVAMTALVAAIQGGAGLLMIGGWTSFTGAGGDYGQTPLAPLLPVICAAEDDRRNVASGLWLEPVATTHPLLRGLDLAHPPVVCGYNAVQPAAGATLVANGRLVAFSAGRPTAGACVPLLTAWSTGAGRAVALMTDLTPHWCGGIVDWGDDRIVLPNGAVVGPSYIRLVENLLGWAAGRL